MRLTVLLLSNVVLGLLIPDLQSIFGIKPENGLKINETPNKHDFTLAPILETGTFDSIVPDRYIVVFKEVASIQEIDHHRIWVLDEYKKLLETVDTQQISKTLKFNLKANTLDFFTINDFKGYFGYMTPNLVHQLQKSNIIKYIEKDTKVYINEYDIQKNAPWGLARTSQRSAFVSTNYEFDNEGGKGVTAYVIDTGIKTTLAEFEGRAIWGDSFAFPKLKIDGNGHGTHCAGIIGSKTYGVAKKVDLVAIGVMNFLGSGVTSDIIKGVEYVVNDHNNNVATRKAGFKGSVINMSLGGGSQDTLDLALNAATKAGIHVAVAAGNDNQDACDYSPARATGPITVGATNAQDARSDFSNWGKCVDVFAPGEEIKSTYIYGETSVLSGTSMASPHVAGLLAYYLSLAPEVTSEFSSGLLTPEALKQKLISYGTKGVLSNIIDVDSPNILAYNGAGNLTDFW